MEAHWKRAASASWYNVYYVHTLGTWDGIAHVMYWFSSFRVAIGVCYHKENNHMTMFIIRNAYYQWLLYTPHLLKLSNSFKPLWNHNILLFTYTYLILLLPPHTCPATLPSVSSSFKLSGAQLHLTWVYKLSLYKITVYAYNSPHHLRICSTPPPYHW